MKGEIGEADVALSKIVEEVLNFPVPNSVGTARPPTTDPQRAAALYNLARPMEAIATVSDT